MPAAGFHKRTYTGRGPWENPDAVPFSDVPDCSRGSIRLAAEIALAELRGATVSERAHHRAHSILNVLAFS